MERVAQLFQATERCFGKVKKDATQRLTGLSSLMTNKVLNALRDPSSYPRRQLDTKERQAARNLLRRYTPIQHLVSRHTRDLLRRYFKDGMLSTPIAGRQVEDRFIDLTADERALYEELEEYIASTYNQASARDRSAVGFVMTIYRRRLASSFRALRHTLSGHLAAMTASDQSQLTGSEEDAPDDEAVDEILDADEVADMEREVLVAEETDDIEHLLDLIGRLPPDSKLESLKDVLDELRKAGFKQAMVFTQYTDTMDFLREALARRHQPAPNVLFGSGGRNPLCGRVVADGLPGRRPTPVPQWRSRCAAVYRRCCRGAQLSVLRCADQLRYAVESDAG